jgi:hypothetical protein
MIAVLTLFLGIVLSCNAEAQISVLSGGITLDSSSNMLLRPNGESGTMTMLYGDIGYAAGPVDMYYDLHAGLIERYTGIQYHRHDVTVSWLPVLRHDFSVGLAAEGSLSRFGDVTLVEGYEQYGLRANMKRYLMPALLLRAETTLKRRSYRSWDMENYSQADGFVRLDRFFRTGTTVRGQAGYGSRTYDSGGLPGIDRMQAELLAAQSIGRLWGLSLDIGWAKTDTPSSGESAVVFDRLFLDDEYKYSSTDYTLSIKHLFASGGTIRLRTMFQRRDYDSEISSVFYYLPESGWTEDELGFYLTFETHPEFFPAFMHPSIELYRVVVDASVSGLSYDATGFVLRFDVR